MSVNAKGILTDFILSLQKDITERAIAAGNNVTGETLRSLSFESTETKGILFGAPYIMVLEDGRGPSKGSGSRSGSKLQDIIYKWIGDKGVFNIQSEREKKSLSYIIARKIHQEGTTLYRKGGKSGVISGVITDERINAFIETFGKVTYDNFKEEAYQIFKNLETIKV